MSSDDITAKVSDETKIEEVPAHLPVTNWKQYINVPLIKALAHHCSGTIVAMLFYALVGEGNPKRHSHVSIHAGAAVLY